MIQDLAADSAPNKVLISVVHIPRCTFCFACLSLIPSPPTGTWVDPSIRSLCETPAKRICQQFAERGTNICWFRSRFPYGSTACSDVDVDVGSMTTDASRAPPELLIVAVGTRNNPRAALGTWMVIFWYTCKRGGGRSGRATVDSRGTETDIR